MTLLGIDVGTTHCKAGLFTETGAACRLASRPTPVQQMANGRSIIDPERLWQTILTVIGEVTADPPTPVAAIGIASMAETGLLLDRQTGQPRSELIPWFDQSAAPQAQQIRHTGDDQERFCTFGIYPSFKCSLAKILWLRSQDAAITGNAIWLHAADYIAYRLTGVLVTDYTLAGRTYAFNLASKSWDAAWLNEFGLTPDIFPDALPGGTPAGRGLQHEVAGGGLAQGTPVAVCGHDHLCAAFAAGAITPGVVFNSMGTAETLVGAMAERPLTSAHYESGLTFGHHTARNRMYWLGGSAASGGSVEWLRAILGDPPLTYETLAQLAAEMSPEPGELIYLPYLSGRGAPWPDTAVRGAFVGLSTGHHRADLLKAVFEGTAYQFEAIRHAAADYLNQIIHQVVVGGGGVRSQRWLQIKADVGGCPLSILPITEATLLGAALLAGLGSGLFQDEQEALAGTTVAPPTIISPDNGRHQMYQHLYKNRFLPLQEPLQAYFQTQSTGDSHET